MPVVPECRLKRRGSKIPGYLLPVLLLVGITTCKNQASPTAVQKKISEVHPAAGKPSQPVATGTAANADDSGFDRAFQQFAQAIRRHDSGTIDRLARFPLLGAAASNHLNDSLPDPMNDTVGVTAAQWPGLRAAMLDKTVVAAFKSPDEAEIMAGCEEGAVQALLEQQKDPGSRLYTFHIEYVRGNREGGKFFIFARINGQYRWVAYLCDGMLY